MNAALEELATITDPFQDQPFIYRYEVGGRRYIQIVNFEKHQNVHPNEVASNIPPMRNLESAPLAKCHEPIVTSIEPLAKCHEPSAPMVGAHTALPSFPSCTSFTSLQGARASDPSSGMNQSGIRGRTGRQSSRT